MATTKKWVVSILLACLVLILALAGGRWGSSFTASANVNAAPLIDTIDPTSVLVDSPDTTITIQGLNFGNSEDTRVWISEGGVNELLVPLTITPVQITVVLTADLLDRPAYFAVRVIKSTSGSPPTIPTIPTPPDEEISNTVYFTVWSPYIYLPLIQQASLK